MSVKTIKNVDEEAWFELKAMANKSNVPVGKMLEKMVSFYKDKSNKFWSRILSGEKILSDKEAREMENVVKKMRKEHGFRG